MKRRIPYVGDGVDGCLRSAKIDESEADTYPTGSEDYAKCLTSAERWREQAVEIQAETIAAMEEGLVRGAG